MFFGLIALVVPIALVVTFVLVTDATSWLKGLAAVLLALSFLWHYGFFLRVALSICISLYFTYLKARN